MRGWLMVCGLLLLAAPAGGEERRVKIDFHKTQLDPKFRSEGVAAGDFNNDGRIDIAAGSVWFEAPDWKMHSILDEPAEFDPKAYSQSFCNFAEDLNGDGWIDLIVVDFPGAQTWWFENPQSADGPWMRHEITPVTNNESPTYLDIDGDGRRELLFGDGAPRIALARPRSSSAAEPWEIVPVSALKAPGTDRFSHGIGAGDINGDGRDDVLVTAGWWEQPARLGQEWVFHPAPFGEPCSQMYAYDFDGDGDADVLSSSAHAFGIWWHEQTPEGWKTHEIDRSFSQTHSLCLVDIDGDGLKDFVTGKRWWAHVAGDPGVDGPAVIAWFQLARKDGKPVWTPHQFDHDSGVGTQFEVVDVNGDGLLDVITSSKKGTHYFQQHRE